MVLDAALAQGMTAQPARQWHIHGPTKLGLPGVQGDTRRLLVIVAIPRPDPSILIRPDALEHGFGGAFPIVGTQVRQLHAHLLAGCLGVAGFHLFVADGEFLVAGWVGWFWRTMG